MVAWLARSYRLPAVPSLEEYQRTLVLQVSVAASCAQVEWLRAFRNDGDTSPVGRNRSLPNRKAPPFISGRRGR